MTDTDATSYKIAQVERMTGVGAHTLRAWERRYGVPEPDRSGGRQRMYSLADVEVINRMRRFADQGMPLARAAQLAHAEMRPGPGESLSVALSSGLSSALLAWDEAHAVDVWTRMLESFDLQTAFERVVIPLLVEVGDGWHDGTISIAQEHYVTNFVRARLDSLARQVPPPAAAPVVLLACLEDEQHEIGLLMLAVMVRLSGIRTIYLGQDVPDEPLLRTVEDAQPAVVALHAGTETSALRLPALVAQLKEAAPLAEIVLGGPAFRGQPDAVHVAGAHYGGADLAAAVVTINHYARKARTGGKR